MRGDAEDYKTNMHDWFGWNDDPDTWFIAEMETIEQRSMNGAVAVPYTFWPGGIMWRELTDVG